MSAIEETIRERLLALKDEQYKAFTCSLMPTVPPERVIGVRTPELRTLAKGLCRREDKLDYLRDLPHQFHEENLIHCRFIESIRDYEQVLEELERFLPYVDNWAVCDSLNPKVLRRHLPEFLPRLRIWMDREHLYTVRFAVGMLLRYYLDEDTFSKEYLVWVAQLNREEYYIRMMQAWYFSEALAKQYEAALLLLRQRSLSDWVLNKAIQKALESRKIPEERKNELRELRTTKA